MGNVANLKTGIERVNTALSAPDFQKAMSEAMPNGASLQRMIRGGITAMQLNPELMNCDIASIKLSMMTAAQFGFDLAPALGQAYLVPFKGKCTLIPGYQGLIKLALQSPHVTAVWPVVVYERDHFKWSLGLNPNIEHVPAEGDRGKAVKFYCVVRMRDADPVFIVMSKEECLKHGKNFSKMFEHHSSKWKDPKTQDAMCLKTVVRAALKFVPKSADDPLAIAIQHDAEADGAIEVSATVIDDFDQPRDLDDIADSLSGGAFDRAEVLARISQLALGMDEKRLAALGVKGNIEDLSDEKLAALLEVMEAAQ